MVPSYVFEELYNKKSEVETVIIHSREKLVAITKAKRDMDEANLRIKAQLSQNVSLENQLKEL